MRHFFLRLLPVLLPVYYLAFDGYMAAINGQTGKVSVRSIKESHYFILPWWLKAIISTVLSVGAIALGTFLFGAERDLIMTATACAGLILAIVFFCAYSQYREDAGEFMVDSERKIFTSKGGPFIRDGGLLVQSKKILKKPVTAPLFFFNINGKREVVELKFTSPLRVPRTCLIAVVVMFFPVILALIINGFHFSQINLGGSAAWFCLTVPLTPVMLVKYGRLELYNNPWIYIVGEDGKKKRYKPQKDKNEVLEFLKDIIPDLIKPPMLFLTLFVIMLFFAMVYATAFGWE